MRIRFTVLLLFVSVFCSAQSIINRANRFGGDLFYPTTLPNVLHVWYNDYNGASGDGTAATQWNDLVGSADATEATNSPEIDTSTGEDQLYFNGTDFLTAQADGGDMDFLPGTDDFYVVIKWGGQINTADSGCWFCKSTGSTASRQYQLSTNSSGTVQIYVGGQTVDGAAGTIANNSFMIINVSTSDVNMWFDGTKEIDAITLTGTNTTTEAVEIGSREGGGYNPEGNIQWIAVGTGILDGATVIELNSLYNEN